MRKLVFTIAILALFPFGATAETTLDRVRTLLDQADVNGLEIEIAALHRKAKSSRDATELREVYERLFYTTHEERLATIEAWKDQNPRSRYAATAHAWAILRATEMSGELYATTNSLTDSQKGALDLRRTTYKLINRVYRSAGDFVPAIDIAIKKATRQGSRKEKAAFFEIVAPKLMRSAPDRNSVHRLVELAKGSAASPAGFILEVCLEYGEIAHGYDPDICIIEAALRHYLDDDIKARAFAVLPTRDEPYLDDLRLEALTNGRAFWERDRTPEFKAQLQELLAGARKHRLAPEKYKYYDGRIRAFLEKGEGVGTLDESSFYDYLDEYLIDDPLNYKLIVIKLERLVQDLIEEPDPVKLTHARKIWTDALRYGHNEQRIWLLGDALAGADREPYDVEDQMVFMENHIANSNQSIFAMYHYFHRLTLARQDAEQRLGTDIPTGLPDPASVLERIKCPMLRAATMISLLCRSQPDAYGNSCDPEKPYMELIPTVLAEGQNGSCPSVSSVPISDQRFTNVPVEDIAIPWRNGTSN